MIDHEPHVSDLRWDQLLAGDLPEATRQTVHHHATQCAACAIRLRELTAERDAFGLQPLADLGRDRSRSTSSAPPPSGFVPGVVAAAPPMEDIGRPAGLAPAYRDDLDAARARCASLEAELRGTRNQLARLDELASALGVAKGRGHRDASEHGELEEQVVALQRELRDLELLGRGDAAMTEELAAIEQKANARRGQGELELYVAGTRARALAGPVWAPRRRMSRTARRVLATFAAALGLVPVAWGAAVAVERSKTVIPRWSESAADIALWSVVLAVAGWFCALGLASVVAAMRAAREEAKIENALVGPDELCGRPWNTARAIQFAPAELVVRFPDRDLAFDSGNPHFQVLVDYARAAAVKHGLEIEGELPALPEVSSHG